IGFDFYSADREAVDVKYESQRLANTSAMRNALPSEFLDNDNKLFQYYHHIKSVSL
ncbi:hypothetical protein SK128_022839, partial [Halocaridina rubra]